MILIGRITSIKDSHEFTIKTDNQEYCIVAINSVYIEVGQEIGFWAKIFDDYAVIDERQPNLARNQYCSVCKSTNWWWQPPGWGGLGEWLCNRCHPKPKK